MNAAGMRPVDYAAGKVQHRSANEEGSMDTDEVLKSLARESVKQGENLRSGVRELTLNALKGRELTIREIKRVVKAVTEGVNLGAATSKIDADRVLGEAF